MVQILIVLHGYLIIVTIHATRRLVYGFVLFTVVFTFHTCYLYNHVIHRYFEN